MAAARAATATSRRRERGPARPAASKDTFGARGTLEVGAGRTRSSGSRRSTGADACPFSLKVLLENLLRTEDGANITADHIRALAGWDPDAEPDTEIQFTPARVIMQDFTGVPCVVDLATMREAVADLGGDPTRINPLAPGRAGHRPLGDHRRLRPARTPLERNIELEYQRNHERYQFLRWGQTAFDEFKVVPPGTGIVHQVNIEYLARVVMTREVARRRTVLRAYPDTCVGTDSHTTMVNGLGVLGWGVGGIEAEAAMLGQPVSMLIPRVVGFKLTGEIPAGATATDVVLTITEQLRKHGVVGKFVEFYGEGVAAVPLANRATIGNMSPEFGSTCAIFPIDDVTLDYLRLTGRSGRAGRAGRGVRQGAGPLARPGPRGRATRSTSSSTCRPSSRASPGRSARRTGSRCRRPRAFRTALRDYAGAAASEGTARRRRGVRRVVPGQRLPGGRRRRPHAAPPEPARDPGAEPGEPARPVRSRWPTAREFEIDHGAVVIASITSCTNTSNPSVMIAAALLAKNAVERGLTVKPWVKTSLAPGSKVVMDYYEKAGLRPVPGEARLPPGRATAARPASATPARCRRRSRPRSRRTTWRWSRCCPATATSRAGSTPTSR